jgi:glucosamine kinase
MGLAGTLQAQRRNEFLALLPAGIPYMLHTDGYAQLMGAAGAQPGICLAVGTGSVIHWLDASGQHSMAGGWGFPVGDQGSGAWIGMRLLQLYIAHRDGNSSRSPVMVALEKRTGSSVSDVQRWTTESRSSNLAQLAPLVFEAATAGDTVAIGLLEESMDHCMDLINYAPSALPVYVVGGVGMQLTPLLSRRLGDRLQPGKGDALRGLWHLAMRDPSI